LPPKRRRVPIFLWSRAFRRSRREPSRSVIGNPNQLGSAPGVASGRISRSVRSRRRDLRYAKFDLRRSMKPGSFFSWARPTAACRSVIFRL